MAVRDNVGGGKISMQISGASSSRFNAFTALNAKVTGKCKATVTITASVDGSGNYASITIGNVTRTYGSGTYTLTGEVNGSGYVSAGGKASNDCFVNVTATAVIESV